MALTRGEVVDRVRKVIDELGRLTPGEIARLLEREGIKGRPNSVVACPVARYIRREVGWPVDIGPYHAWVPDSEVPAFLTSYEALELPNNLRGFIDAFDKGCYPELVEPEEG